MESIVLQTSDGVEIHADWYGVKNASVHRVALLLHMMPATKESWTRLALALNARGVSVLAIDLRGHGASTKQGDVVLDYKTFADADHQASKQDVETALAWLKDRAFEDDHIALVGASIGANLALRVMAERAGIRVGILLSPGMDYHGVKTDDAMKRLTGRQMALLCASDDDPESFSSVNTLNDLNRTHSFRLLLDHAGHGTAMFENDPAFLSQMTEWIDKSL